MGSLHWLASSPWCCLGTKVKVIRLEHLSTRRAGTEVGLSSFFSNFPCLCFYAIAPLTKRKFPSTPCMTYLVFLSCQSFFWCTCEVFLPICSPFCRYCLLSGNFYDFDVSYMQLCPFFFVLLAVSLLTSLCKTVAMPSQYYTILTCYC